MQKLTVYGLPLNPMPLLEEHLSGRSFCVSYGTRDKLGRQLDDAIRLVDEDGILLVDNGAFSHWKKNKTAGMTEEYVAGYEAWAADILERCPQAIAVIPDVIGGTMEENAELVLTTMLDTDRAMPIWHMHEPISYLLYLCESFNYVGFGSTADKPGSKKWHARIREAFAAIDAWEAGSNGAYIRPRLHMMRAQAFAHMYPFDSSDSTNVAMNHSRQLKKSGHTIAMTAARVDGKIQASAGPASEHQIKRPLQDPYRGYHDELLLKYWLMDAGYNIVSTDEGGDEPSVEEWLAEYHAGDAMHEDHPEIVGEHADAWLRQATL